MTAEQEGRSRAEYYRLDNRLGLQPLGDLVTLIERLEGIDVAILPVDDPEAHGLTMSDPATGVTRIAAAATNNPMRQRSTLAHELAHHVFDDHLDPSDPQWGQPGLVESRADAFARHLLLPLEAIELVLPDIQGGQVTEQHLSLLVQQYLISPAMVAIQLRQRGLIDEVQKQLWMSVKASTGRLAARYGWSEQYAALSRESLTHRSPQQLLAQLTDAYIDGIVGIRAIANVRRMRESDLRAEFEATDITPLPDAVMQPRDGAPQPIDPVDVDALEALFADDEEYGSEDSAIEAP